VNEVIQYRQGEVLLVRVDKVPNGLNETAKFSSILLGHGETGNTHTLVAKDVQWLISAIDDVNSVAEDGASGSDEPLFVNVPEGGLIEHSATDEGHADLEVDPGTYQVFVKREQFPGEQRSFNVFD
jgi:hypothetical protein